MGDKSAVTLEIFNTDGLRTPARTLDVPNMKEKTFRYPGYIEKMAVFRETGFFDRFEEATGVHSMARTTGYTAKVAARMIARGLYARKGISVPECIGRVPDCIRFMLAGLKERHLVYCESSRLENRIC
jgi:saccharopine dehydrogenase-like NADP-dependent oxidoreductase